MSGPAIHHLIARELPDRFRDATSDRIGDRPLADVLADHPVHLSLGAQGPDFLFFLVGDVIGTPGGPDANALSGWLARATLDASRQVEEMNTQLLEAAPLLEEILVLKERLDAGISDTIERSRVLSALREAASAIEQLVAVLVDTVATGAKAAVAETIDVFSVMSNPTQTCEPLEHWWWFDILHYRRSGEYATALLRRAVDEADEELAAYAVGYLSHYAADSVGHPYVNTLARGPYRFHGQRHKVVENGQDVWAWDLFGEDAPRHVDSARAAAWLEERFGPVQGPQQASRMHDGEFVTSQLHLDYLFDSASTGPAPSPSAEEHALLPTLDPDVSLPDAIADGIHATLAEVYGGKAGTDGRYPRLPEPDEIKAAYRLWYGYLRGTTSNGVLPPAIGGHVPLTDDIEREVRKIVAEAGQTARNVADAAQDAAEGILDLAQDLFEEFEGSDFPTRFDPDAILGMMGELADAILDGAAEAAALLDQVLGDVTESSVAAVKTVIQIAYQKLYAVYLHFRKLLAATGLGFPPREMIAEARFRHMTDPQSFPDATGRRLADPAVRDFYPVLALARAKIDLPVLGTHDIAFMKAESHLIYPPVRRADPRIERPDSTAATMAARPGPEIYETQQPDYYMWDAPPVNDEVLDRLIDLGDDLRTAPGDGADDAALRRELDGFAAHLDQPILGNATDLTVALAQRVLEGRTLPDVNLDGDRGVLFPCWLMPDGHYADHASGRVPDPADAGDVNITPDPRNLV